MSYGVKLLGGLQALQNMQYLHHYGAPIQISNTNGMIGIELSCLLQFAFFSAYIFPFYSMNYSIFSILWTTAIAINYKYKFLTQLGWI